MSCCVGLFLTAVVLALAALKIILKLLTGWDRSPTCLVGKTALVTGANTGIGFYTALDFAKRGARVILACRNETKAEQAKERIIKETENPNIVVRILDLSSLASVRKFAKEIKETEENLHILVNNAGVVGQQKTTVDGLDWLLQSNHLGHFLLTILLIDLMKKSEWGRIVNVSSLMAYTAQLNADDLNAYPKGFFANIVQYSNTKLCNILFTNELARRLKGTGIQANSVHPGTVYTEINRELDSFFQLVYKIIGKCFLKTAEEGAQTSIYLAVSPRVELISGEYFDNCKIQWMPKAGRNIRLARKIWEKSAELVKLSEDEKRI